MNNLKQPQTAGSRRIPVIAWCAIVAGSIAVFWGNLRYGEAALAVGLEDDFFYYAQVARNLARHGTSTFDGIHQTNGYHPLWLLVITAMTKVFDIQGLLGCSTMIPFAFALETLQILLVMAISYFIFRLCRMFCKVPASLCIMLLIASFALSLVRTGMEVGLTLTLTFAVLCFRLREGFRWSARESLLYGLLASLVVLSRLDSILLFALLSVFDLLPNAKSIRERVRNGFLFCLGMCPLLPYFLLNRLIFQTIMPVSGTAKQLRLHHMPSLITLKSVVPFFTARVTPMLGPCVLLTIVAIAVLSTRKRSMFAGNKGVFYSCLLFPFVHLLLISTLSDWPIWVWYLYPWIISGAAGAIITAVSWPLIVGQLASPSAVNQPFSRFSQLSVALSLTFFLAFTAAMTLSSHPRKNSIYNAGLDIRRFADEHPGIYAMGDRGGAVGYLVKSPVIQLEGLMMDKEYLDNIRHRRDLLDVMKDYGVRYYVTTRSVEEPDGCYPVREPWQAGPDSPVMQARLCRIPIATFTNGEYVNHVFDLSAPPIETAQRN